MKNLAKKPFIFTFAVLFTLLTILSDVAYAGRGGGGRGGGGGSRGGGGARTSSVQRSSGSRSSGSRSNASRGGGASPRVGSSTSLQNRGSFSNSSQSRQGNRQASQGDRQNNRQTNQGDRQGTRSENQGNRQANQGDRQNNRNDAQGNRQDNRSQNQSNRQDNMGNRQDNRQNNAGNRQDNRQDFVNDNWRGGGWYGGGYYAPPGWGAWAGLAGLTTGLVIGASVSTPPPYYDTVYVGSTSYLYSDGVYMQPSGSSYIVSSPPVGVVVNYLPDGCNLVQDGDYQYYDCAGIYYETVYQNGATVYKVVQY